MFEDFLLYYVHETRPRPGSVFALLQREPSQQTTALGSIWRVLDDAFVPNDDIIVKSHLTRFSFFTSFFEEVEHGSSSFRLGMPDRGH